MPSSVVAEFFRSAKPSRVFPERSDRSAGFRWFLLVAIATVIVLAGIRPAFAQSPVRPAVKPGKLVTPATPATPEAPATPASPSAGPFAQGHILVAKNPGSADSDFHGALNAHGGNSLGRLNGLNVHVVNVAPGKEKDTVARLSANPHVKFAEVDTLMEPSAIANDPNYSSAWHLTRINAPTAWDYTWGSGITIAILDTGVDGTHPDLSPQMVAGWNFYDNNSNTSDVYGHGTAVAGIAAAASNNGVGVASIAGSARIMPMRISDPTGYAYWSTVAQGLTWAADHGARVANISYQGAAGSSTIQSAASYMRSKGGVVYVASGNTGALDSTSPNNALMVVSATDSNDLLASFSTFGSFVGISAPGVGIWTTTNGGGYSGVSGTSAATPVVAGSAALVLAKRPDFTPSQVDSTLKSTAVDLGGSGSDIYFGSGRVNAGAAVQAAAGTSVTPDTTPPTVSISSPTGGTVSGTVSVSVNASDNIGVVKVELRVNGVTVASDNSAPYTFPWNTATIADGAASLTAVAYDAAGNSKVASPVSVNVSNTASPPTDTTPPTVSIASPTGGTVVGTVIVSVNASDNVGVTKVELRVNGVTIASDAAGPYQFSWDSTTTANGAASLTAVAYDAAGNTTPSAMVAVNVSNASPTQPTDATPPTLTILSPFNGSTTGTIVKIATSATDNGGAAGITQSLYIDGALKTTVTGSTLSFNWNTKKVAPGGHTLLVTAHDAAGNSTSQQVQVMKK